MIKQSQQTRRVTEEMVCPNLALALIEIVENGDHAAAVELVRSERYRRTQDGYYAPLGKMAVAFRDQWAPFYQMIEQLGYTTTRGALICLWNADKGGQEVDEYLTAAERLIEQLAEIDARAQQKVAEAAQEMSETLAEPRYTEDTILAAAVGRRAATLTLPDHTEVYVDGVPGFRAVEHKGLPSGPWRRVTAVRRAKGGVVHLDVEKIDQDTASTVTFNPNKRVTLRYRVEE